MNPYLEVKNLKELCKILGLPPSEAGKIEMRRDLVIAIRATIAKNKWTHVQAAKRAQVGRTVITGIVNGNIERISTDRLMDIASNLGLYLKLKVD